MAKRQDERYVVKAPQGGWNVKRPGHATPDSHHRTQAGAERAAKDALKKTGGEVRKQGRDGKWIDSDTVKPSPDPNPPRDLKH